MIDCRMIFKIEEYESMQKYLFNLGCLWLKDKKPILYKYKKLGIYANHYDKKHKYVVIYNNVISNIHNLDLPHIYFSKLIRNEKLKKLL